MRASSTASESSLAARKYPLGRRILLAFVPRIAALLLHWLAATLRYENICEPGAAPATAEETEIWCFWHQCLLTAACCFQHRYRAGLLISQSFDGELIARTIHRLGFLTARGSSSRSGSTGFRELARQLEDGIHAVFPADGPRGPRYRLKPGPIKLAQLSGHKIGPFHTLPARAWRLNSWDAFLIPKPYSRVVITWATPISIPAELSDESFEAARREVEAALERIRLLAEAHLKK